MFSCSYDAEVWIRHSLRCLPEAVRFDIEPRVAFVCVDSSDARRLSREFCDDNEIIILSERIIPRGPLVEDHWQVRYFMFAVLHEVAHALRNHRSPQAISAQENADQEREADELAFNWFNNHLSETNQPIYSQYELMKAQQENQAAWKIRFG